MSAFSKFTAFTLFIISIVGTAFTVYWFFETNLDELRAELVSDVRLGSPIEKNIPGTYRAETDGFIFAMIRAGSSQSSRGDLFVYVDSIPPEGEISKNARAILGMDFNSSTKVGYNSTMLPVKKGEYYKVSVTSVSGTTPITTVYWIPLEVTKAKTEP